MPRGPRHDLAVVIWPVAGRGRQCPGNCRVVRAAVKVLGQDARLVAAKVARCNCPPVLVKESVLLVVAKGTGLECDLLVVAKATDLECDLLVVARATDLECDLLEVAKVTDLECVRPVVAKAIGRECVRLVLEGLETVRRDGDLPAIVRPDGVRLWFVRRLPVHPFGIRGIGRVIVRPDTGGDRSRRPR